MPVVPISTPRPRVGPTRIQDTRPPPDTPFALMAAAQMHSEGRLIPAAPDLYETRPQASLGGRSLVEANNPNLGPSDAELYARQQEMELARRRNAK